MLIINVEYSDQVVRVFGILLPRARIPYQAGIVATSGDLQVPKCSRRVSPTPRLAATHFTNQNRQTMLARVIAETMNATSFACSITCPLLLAFAGYRFYVVRKTKKPRG